mgnify:CR=1 FL=1
MLGACLTRGDVEFIMTREDGAVDDEYFDEFAGGEDVDRTGDGSIPTQEPQHDEHEHRFRIAGA